MIILTPAQSEIARDTHRFRVLDAGRRFGKTILACEEIIGYAVSRDDVIVPYIAPTYGQARDIAWRHLVNRLQAVIIGKPNETRLEITVRNKHNGQSLISLRGWESIESLRGQKFPFIVADEVAMYRDFWVGWQEVLRPALTDLSGGALFISTPKGFNHFYDLYNLQDDPKVNAKNEWQSWKFTSYDNPHIPKDEIEAAKLSMTEDRFAQEYLADFRKQEGLVYREFDRSEHLYDDLDGPSQVIETIVGVDFGYHNPSAVLLIKKDFDNVYWIDSEWYKTNKVNSEIVEYVRALMANAVYPDPAEPDRIEEMRRAGIPVREVIKDIPKGIDTIQALFRSNRLKIHKRCQNLISELEMYRYPEKKADHNEPEVPIKENDHALDALRYALSMNQPSHVIEDPNFSLYRTSYR